MYQLLSRFFVRKILLVRISKECNFNLSILRYGIYLTKYKANTVRLDICKAEDF
jgi:hypothetical protein